MFGNPVRPRKGLRGRPPKEYTAQDLDALEGALVHDWTNERIAKMLGIGVSTLKRHFGPKLAQRKVMGDRLFQALFTSAVRKAIEKGDMGAVRQVRAMVDEQRRDAMERALGAEVERAADTAAADRRLGKKQLAQLSAREAELELDAELEREASRYGRTH